MKKIVLIIGTRPELIKIYPLINKMKQSGFNNYLIVNSGQHQEMLTPFFDFFSIKPDYNLDIMSPGQSLADSLAKAVSQLESLLITIRKEGHVPSVLMAQGDTTTVMATALVAFYNRVRFFHLEAGLRSDNLLHPFPEELNRRVASITADFHYAPTRQAIANLKSEKIPSEKIMMAGNTVVDAIELIRNSPQFNKVTFSDLRVQQAVDNGNKNVLITCHRRENHLHLQHIISAVEQIAAKAKNCMFIWPVHANPMVKDIVIASGLQNLTNMIICEPLNYLELLKVMSTCCKILTDSGGIQEEAPSFRVPVLVMRETTERPEAIEKGYAVLVGNDSTKMIDAFMNFNPVFPMDAENPFGDGKASDRIVDHIKMQL
ncbi:MAG: UDP-N-acetylglucosamine 2-epimerase (non-hydrolyzing) [Bacteroidia bacterium]|nr:UDP-N-acetylglucosamine 2-epimerase (non-hydrolyzing) [Bacteroidia bacterium]